MRKKRLKVLITIPVYNEEKELKENVLKLYGFLTKVEEFDWQIVVVDNASFDKTPAISQSLNKKYKEIFYLRLEKKGRGRAVKTAWKTFGADIFAYMDVDLSTDLNHLLPLVNSLTQGYEIAIGSRLLRKSKIYNRSLKREIISRAYNILIKIFFQTKFSDAQCGFKAVTKKVVNELLPYIEDNSWFMDSELLIVGEKAGYKIYEEPVAWQDNPGSTVRVLPTAWGDFKGLVRLFMTRPWEKIAKT